jgi:hypothetical protein
MYTQMVMMKLAVPLPAMLGTKGGLIGQEITDMQQVHMKVSCEGKGMQEQATKPKEMQTATTCAFQCSYVLACLLLSVRFFMQL